MPFAFARGGVAAAPDIVTLAPRTAGAGRIVMKGTVLDYTGAQLTLQDAQGDRLEIPGKQVVEVASTWTAPHVAGDAAWAAGDFAAAASNYQAALAAEPRRWAQRMIQARFVAALRESGRWEDAADAFLRLVRDDPATPYFDVVPLAWTTLAPSPTLEAKARAWLADRTSEATALVGASLLVSGASRADALRRLAELSRDAAEPVRSLAEAQAWRAASVTADAATVAAWESAVDKLPENLQAGPRYVVGRAWASHSEPERAALQLLRVPILHGDRQPRLAAEALWSAGQAIERLARPAQAADLYRELLRDYPETSAAATARNRLQELKL